MLTYSRRCTDNHLASRRRNGEIPDNGTAIVRDRRVDRTQSALLNAFREIFFRQGYDRVTVGEIVRRAGVGRSTFYEHFECKDDLLRASATPLLSLLADGATSKGNMEGVTMLLEHCTDYPRFTRKMLAGSTGRLLRNHLASLIEARLQRSHPQRRSSPALVAHFIAAGQLGMIEAWLSSRACSSRELAAEIVAGLASLANF